MDITIDTTHPLNDRDRAILRALLDGTQTTAPAPAAPAAHQPARQRPNSAEAIAGLVAPSPRKPDGAIASAKLPVASQPGMTITESTSEDDDPAG
jgi:hypothetical protein